MQYNMNTRPDTWPGVEDEAAEHATNMYLRSSSFTTDAIEWAADHMEGCSALVDLACDYYRESSHFAMAVDDIMAGEKPL